MRYPFTPKLHRGENIGVGNCSRFENVLAGSEMPPKVWISDWSRGSCEDHQQEEDDQQTPIKGKDRAFTQLEMYGGYVCRE